MTRKWDFVEFLADCGGVLTCQYAPEGHIRFIGGEENHFIVTQALEYGDRMMGSFIGAHVAEIPVAYGGREVALKHARLIASAPELLAACQKAYRVLDMLGYRVTDTLDWREAERAARIAKSAIVKATGSEVE